MGVVVGFLGLRMMLHSVASDNEVVDKLVGQRQENARQQQP